MHISVIYYRVGLGEGLCGYNTPGLTHPFLLRPTGGATNCGL